MKRFLGVCLVAGMAIGCAELQVTRPIDGSAREPKWEIHRDAVALLQRWSLYGRIAMQTPEEGWQAGLDWRQVGDTYTLRLMAPFGRGTYGLEGGPHGVTILTPDARRLYAPDAEALTREQLGWEVPVKGLHYWVRGIPDPDQPVTALSVDEAGRMVDLQQSGWRISIRDYTRSERLDLPVKLEMEHAGRLKVRLVIQRWETG